MLKKGTNIKSGCIMLREKYICLNIKHLRSGCFFKKVDA